MSAGEPPGRSPRRDASFGAMLEALVIPDQGEPSDRRSRDWQARWREVLEVGHEAYVAIDAQGRVVDWNRRAQALFGWSCSEAIGMPARALVARGATGNADFPERLLALAPDELGEPFDLSAVDRHGRVFAAHWSVWGVDRRGGHVVHAFVHDVTEVRREEEWGALLTAVVEGSADAIITRDLEGVILSWNAAAERIYGWTARQAVGRPDSLIVPADKVAELEEMVQRLREGERVGSIETEWCTRGGTRVPVALSLSPVRDATGRLVATSAIARDVTEQRWMAATLDATLQALQAAAEEAGESDAASRRFLADAAHQLRTPVAGIQACAETLLRGTSADDSDRLLGMMVREASRAGAHIRSLLRMARLDRGLSLTAERVDVVQLCREEVERMKLLSSGIDVHLQVDRALTADLLLDGAACRELLTNLGDNALRHARSSVAITVQGLPCGVAVRVVDDGPGLPGGTEERVFERFVSLDTGGGSGLGLPIARALARAMGGDLVYEHGFLVTLPSRLPHAPQSDALR